MRLWSFGAVNAEHARFTSAFARATVDACAITTGKGRADAGRITAATALDEDDGGSQGIEVP